MTACAVIIPICKPWCWCQNDTHHKQRQILPRSTPVTQVSVCRPEQPHKHRPRTLFGLIQCWCISTTAFSAQNLVTGSAAGAPPPASQPSYTASLSEPRPPPLVELSNARTVATLRCRWLDIVVTSPPLVRSRHHSFIDSASRVRAKKEQVPLRGKHANNTRGVVPHSLL